MKPSQALAALALTLAPLVAASAWSFESATLSVAGKGADGLQEKLTPGTPLKKAVILPHSTSLKIDLAATEGKSGKRPHQAFLTLHEPTTGLEESFAFSLRDNGKGKVEVSSKDLPFQFLSTTSPLKASLVLAAFGSSTPYNAHAFDLTIETDPNTPQATLAPPERYTSKDEIHHIFRADPRSPPMIISLVVTLAVLACLPLLFGGWLVLGGNLDHLGKAFGASPVAHTLFFGSLVALEGVFMLYYYSWTLFQVLPVAGVVGTVAYISGSRALTEVQERRLAGER